MTDSKKTSKLRRWVNAIRGEVQNAPPMDHHMRIVASGHVSIEGGDHFAEGGMFCRIGECPTCRKLLEDAVKTSDNFRLTVSYDSNPTTGCVQLHVCHVEE